MDKFRTFFDDFTFHARVMPILVVLLPILIVGIYRGVLFDNFTENAFLFSIVLVFLILTSKIAREKGKSYEEKMYKVLGAMPTTIILRYTDSMLDDVTKTRYHKKLNSAIDGITTPLTPEEESQLSDPQYDSAVNWLRNYANSNRDKEPRVYQELKEYNFWRNLYGTRIFALSIYFLIAVREFKRIDNFNIRYLLLTPYPQYVALLVMLISIAITCFFVTSKTVKRKAFNYARTLLEVCERI